MKEASSEKGHNAGSPQAEGALSWLRQWLLLSCQLS